MDPLQQLAYSQMLGQTGTATPGGGMSAYSPVGSAAQGLSNGLSPLIQALAQRRMMQRLNGQGQPGPGQTGTPQALSAGGYINPQQPFQNVSNTSAFGMGPGSFDQWVTNGADFSRPPNGGFQLSNMTD